MLVRCASRATDARRRRAASTSATDSITCFSKPKELFTGSTGRPPAGCPEDLEKGATHRRLQAQHRAWLSSKRGAQTDSRRIMAQTKG
ncbi:hypothetical protein EVAR_46505_1 [Eumeta japonica]|uniref:Uncharacterized protein n=1 Tax=Eumeta variegata TaxID=151549 RepID=A0A4C1WV73_EUMVA|nr:hypothetical protein EVAR_46505_1 [Eumeta japonica]